MKKINPCTSLVGFLVALSALSFSAAARAETSELATEVTKAETPSNGDHSGSTIEGRLSRLSTAFQNRADQLPVDANPEVDPLVAQWLNGRGRRGWVNTRRRGGWVNTRRGTGWGDGRRGSWLNGRRGGWADGRRRQGWLNSWGDGRR